MNKVTSYLKNVGKSISYATVDVTSKRLIPEVKDFVDTNDDILKAVFSSVTHSKKSIQYGKKLAAENQVYKDINIGFKNALEDIKSGNIYNKARDDAALDSVAESMFGSDDEFNIDDFNFDDDDFNMDDFNDKPSSVSKGDIVVADTISKTGNFSAQLISKTILSTSNAISQTQINATNMILSQNVNLMSGLRTSIAGMHESVNEILKFVNQDMKTKITNETKYFETTTNLMQENNAIMKEMLEMQRNLYKSQAEKSSTNGIFGTIFSGDTLDIKEYFKAIGKNIKGLDKTGAVGMMTSDMGGSSMLGQMMSNPLGFVMTDLVQRSIPVSLAKNISNFSKTLGNLFPAMISKFNSWKNGNDGILSIIGGLFGIDTSVTDKIDTSKYNKGAIPFDGITRKAIVDVIPEHLARIEAVLTGTSQRVYDYHKGRWMNTRNIKNKQQDEYDGLVKDSFSDVNPIMQDFINALNLDKKSKESIDKDMLKMMKETFQGDGHFSPSVTKKKIKSFKFENEKVMDTLLDLLSDAPTHKISSISKNIIHNKKKWEDSRLEAESLGDSVYGKLYDNSINEDEVYSKNSKKKSKNKSKNKNKSNNKAEEIIKYNKEENIDKVLLQASKTAREKAEARDIEDLENMGKDYSKDNKWRKSVEEIPGDTFIEKFQNANSMKAKFTLIMGSLGDIAKKPAMLLSGLIAKADRSIYNLLFKADTGEYKDTGEKIKGLFHSMLNSMKTKWKELTEDLDEKVIDPLAKKYKLDDKYKEFKDRAKEGLFGATQRDADGKLIKNEYGFAKRSSGILTPTMHALQKDYKNMAGYTKNSISEVLSPIAGDPLVVNFVKELNDKKHKMTRGHQISKLQGIVDNLSDEQKKKLSKDNIEVLNKLGIKGFAKGGKVTKSGLIAVSEGEEVTVKRNTNNQADILRNEIGESNRTLNAIYDTLLNPDSDISEHEATFGIPGFAKGKNKYKKKSKAKKKKNKPKKEKENTEEQQISEEDIVVISELIESIEKNDANYTDKDNKINSKKRSGGPISTVSNKFKELLSFDNPKKEKEKTNNVLRRIIDDVSGGGADIASKSIIGGGLGLLSGVAFGPLIGASVGAAISLSKNSKTINKFLFGEESIDEKTGETVKKGGLISKKVQDTFNKYIPEAGKYGVTGAIASLVLPFGPLAGAAIGAGIGLAKKSETMNNMLFGDKGGLFNKERKAKIKDYFPNAAVGAIAGLFLGPFGMLGNAALGTGLGMLTNTEEFKNLIFGEEGANKTRLGGLKGAIEDHFINPIKNFGTNFKDDFFKMIRESMIDPLNRAITPIATEISYQTKRVVFGIPKMFANIGKEYIGRPLMTMASEYIFEPLGKIAGGFFNSTFNKLKGFISLPFRAIGGVGDIFRKKQIREGRDRVGTAKSRIQFADDNEMGDYNYRTVDKSLLKNSDNEDFLKEATARTGMLAHGADYFEKQVQSTGKQLSKVLAKYVKLGWTSKNKPAWKRIKKFIKDNDVESAISELNNIKQSRTGGGKMTNEEADEAIREFSEVNKTYQATKKAREDFGNTLNTDENNDWMTKNFGENWRSLDAERLFRYSSKELANKQGKNAISKQDMLNNPTKLITGGDTLINTTLERIEELVKNSKQRVFTDEADSIKYDQDVEKGKTKSKAERLKQQLNIKNTLDKNNLDYKDDIVSLLYTNEKVLGLVIYLSGLDDPIKYDSATIRKLCKLKLNDTEIVLLKEYPHIALMDPKMIKKHLDKTRNDHATIFRNGATRDNNLDILNKYSEAGIDITENRSKMLTSSANSTYVKETRLKYYNKFKDLNIVDATIEFNGNKIKLNKNKIIDPEKGLTYEEMDQILRDNGGTADIDKKTSISSSIHNFSDKNLGGVKKVVGKTAGAVGLGALATPIVLPLAALAGLGYIGSKGVKLSNTLGSLKHLGIDGYLRDKKIKSGIDSDLDDRDMEGIVDDTNSNMSNGIFKNATNKIKTFFTENGAMKYIRNKRGDWTLSKDAQTKETLEKNQEEENNQGKMLSSLNSMKEGILGIFNRHKEKDDEEKKEPWYKKLFNFDLGKVGKGLKFGALALAGFTGIGALKNLWDNRKPNGVIDSIGKSVGGFVSNMGNKLINWFSGSDEYEGKGLPAFMENHIYPNLFGGFNVIFGKILPALVKSFIVSLPTLIKAGINGIGTLITSALGWGDKKKKNTVDNAMTTASGQSIGSSSAVESGNTSSSGWMSDVSTGASNIATQMIKEASNTKPNNSQESDIPDRNTGIYNTSGTQLSNNIASDVIDNYSSSTSNPINNQIQTNNQTEEQLNEQIIMGDGLAAFKKDEAGNLIPLTVRDYNNSQGMVPEFYTQYGARYIYDETSDSYISEQTGESVSFSKEFMSRVGKVFTRSVVTGRTMGAMRLGKAASSKFGNTLLGKAGASIVRGTDKALSHIPFIKTPYKASKLALKGTGKLASAASTIGANIGGNVKAYAGYTSDALKEGYKLADVTKDVTGDIATKAKDSMLNSKTGQKIVDITGKAGELTKENSTKIINWVKGMLDKIFNNSVIFGKIKEGLKRAGKESSEKSAKAAIKELMEKMMTKFSGSVLGKLGKGAIIKLTAAIGSGGLITAALSIFDFTTGFDQAESILGVEQVSFVQRLLAGLINIIAEEVFFGLIDASTIVDWCVDLIFPIFNIDVEDFNNKRIEADETTDRYNLEHGTEYTTEEYLKKDKLTYKIHKGWEGTKNWVSDKAGKLWDGAKNIGSNIAKTAGNLYDNTLGNITNDDKIRQKLGLNEDVNVTLQDRFSSGAGSILSKLSGGLLDDDEMTKSIYGGIEKLKEGIPNAINTADKNIGGFFGFTNDNGEPISMTEAAKQGVNKAVKGAQDGWNSFTGAISEAKDKLVNKATEIKDKVVEGASIANDKIGGMLGLEDEEGNPLSLTEGVAHSVDKTVTNIKEGWNDFKTGASEMWKKVNEEGGKFFNKAGEKIGDGLHNVNKNLGAILGLEDENGNPMTLTDSIKKSASDFGKKLSNGWNDFKTGVGDFFGGIGSFFSGAKDDLIKAADSSIDKRNSGRGSGKLGFISQLDPQYANQKFNKYGDTQSQTIGDSGCAPATAANILNMYSGRGVDPMINASQAALKFKEENGGVTPEYFQDYLGKNGIGTYSTMNKNEMISGIRSGTPTVLLGSDPSNRANTPYGASSSHYVLATGTDGKGNAVVQDPESRRPNSLYPIKDLLKQSHLGMITGRGTSKFTSTLKSRLGKLGFGRGTSTQYEDLAEWSEISADELNKVIKKIAGSGRGFSDKGEYFIKAAKASGLNPRYILAHSAFESGWGDSNISRRDHNYFGIGAFDSNPDNASNYGNNGMESGIVNGALWIRKNFYDAGQTTLYNMRFNNGSHEYATDPEWVSKIAGLMDQMPQNGKAVIHEPDGNISIGDSGSSGVNTLFGMLESLPEAYFGKELLSLFGHSSSTSNTSSSGSSNPANNADVEKAISQMESWADDPSVGYDQTFRWAEKGDYDCSTAVITAHQKAGIPVKANGATYTGNMYNVFKKTGFKDVTDSINLSNGDGLQRGDVLLNNANHTAMYSGDGKQVEASINENGKTNGGQPGDQTGNEFLRGNYYNYPWDNVLRYGSGSTGKHKTSKFLNMNGRGSSKLVSSALNSATRRKQVSLPDINNIRSTQTSSYMPSLEYSGTQASRLSSNTGSINNSSNTDKLLGIILDVLRIIANNSEKLSEIVSLLSKSLDVELTNNDISKLSSNNAQIKNKIANALKSQGSSTGMGDTIMNASTESLASAMYSIARA